MFGRVSAEIKVDEKNRIAIPIKLRQGLGSPVIITRGVGQCLYMMSEEVWETSFEDEFASGEMNDDDMVQLERYYKSGLTEAVPDSQGRVVLNTTLREHAKIARESEVILTPMSLHIEIWAKSVVNESFASLDSKTLANMMAAKGIGGRKKSPGK